MSVETQRKNIVHRIFETQNCCHKLKSYWIMMFMLIQDQENHYLYRNIKYIWTKL
jgi:hypothetical protein